VLSAFPVGFQEPLVKVKAYVSDISDIFKACYFNKKTNTKRQKIKYPLNA
jgi:hypothetical protein